MTNKLVVEMLNDEGIVDCIKVYKSLSALHVAYPKIDYHALRQVYLKCNNKEKASKKLQKNSNIKLRIYDYDNYGSAEVIL